jgi:hypothetical protein
MAKIIAMRLIPILSNIISSMQFGFLKSRLIHETVDLAQEDLHTIEIQKRHVSVIKIDLSKAYDRVSWLYLKLLLLHIGFELPLVKWIMSCVSCVSFVSFIVLINGVWLTFFRSSWGLRRGCPLSPYLFLLMVDRFSRVIVDAKRVHKFQGVKLGRFE